MTLCSILTLPEWARAFNAGGRTEQAEHESNAEGTNKFFELVGRTPAANSYELDFAKANFKPVPFESAAQLVKVLEEGAAQTRKALAAIPDDAWNDNWKLTMQGKSIFDGSRFLAYRQMFLNHIVHHRAQLGVYLRMNEEKVPAIYGPSADDTLGF